MATAQLTDIAEPAPVLGLQPWFIWPLSRWRWLNQPVRAERLAALRIGIAFFLLLDLFTTQWPMAADLYSREGLRPLSQFKWRFDEEKHPQRWSLLEKYDSPGAVHFFMSLWTIGAILMLVGCFTRVSIAATWVLNVSFLNANSSIDNAGDTVRQLALFFLMIGRSGAAWSVDAWFRRNYRWVNAGPLGSGFLGLGIVPRRRAEPYQGPFYVYPWVLRLVFIQMIVIYAFNGIAKASGRTWHDGTSLYHVLCDLSLARWSYAMFPTPLEVSQVLTVMVLWWEVLFFPMMLVPWHWLDEEVETPGFQWFFRLPIRWRYRLLGLALILFVLLFMIYFCRWTRRGLERWIGLYLKLPLTWRCALGVFAIIMYGLLGLLYLLRWNREIMLAFGAMFHVGIWLTMEIGFFAPYMLCLYLPLLPWEWWVDRRALTPEPEQRNAQTDPEIETTGDARPPDNIRAERALPKGEGDGFVRASDA